jgi:hypothetical protein
LAGASRALQTIWRGPSWLGLAFLLSLACVLHAGHASAASAGFSAGVSADAERALCEFADISIADGPGACAAAENTGGAEPEPAAGTAPSDGADRAAPMCDNAGASIAVVPDVPEVDRGRFEPARCNMERLDIERLLALLRSDDRARNANVISGSGEKPEPTRLRPQQRLDAACAAGAAWPIPAAPAGVAFGVPRGLAWRRGHAARVERPPSQA